MVFRQTRFVNPLTDIDLLRQCGVVTNQFLLVIIKKCFGRNGTEGMAVKILVQEGIKAFPTHSFFNGSQQAKPLFIGDIRDTVVRSEEHTSELQSLMRISYAVFCLKKKNT